MKLHLEDEAALCSESLAEKSYKFRLRRRVKTVTVFDLWHIKQMQLLLVKIIHC